MTKTSVLVLCSAAICGAAAASPDFSPEDRACQLPCEIRPATPTPVAGASKVRETTLSNAMASEAERRVELRRLLALAGNARQGQGY
jgi:hypothetical protein